ncbi:glutamine--fructose-6-phosphate transaminase (isomerizing) [Candidatus Methylacidithermus pantelleriae]|uniref:Glutamine--fructose-6-phosphate aminotransferase [isomerizing] n=1 Tax=Candidatus Methylacidithermus pantelleriae TaxID=2744239 RepID=A0A8J2BHT8_9BACT|nr:glutamine--fructose-6-phosphate transaminase (isomerizing) [Candidatus Methylacidithermus pantelleriae]CAF0695930.1 Glutamine--fructose-6-phosphate aminotransferase (isomerizing) [Candidatus Methylacidithermus pantelleriae]
MCGIVAYLGEKEAQPLLLHGLRRLEYRGYDSSGIAVVDRRGRLHVVKRKGRISELERVLGSCPLTGTLGISHTRWATHGIPSDANAHPHCDQSGRLALVHNGVIENYQNLRQKLLDLGHSFQSETDTEILAHLIGHYYDQLPEGDPDRLENAVRAALKEVIGTYGIAVIHADHPDLLIGARRGSPLILGIGLGEYFLSSDVTAVCVGAQKVVYLNDGDIVTIGRHSFHISSLLRDSVGFELSELELSEASAELGDYPHYMLKEIFEQPQAIRNAFRGRLDPEEGTAKLGGLHMSPHELLAIRRILIVGCGTARHAGIVGEYLLESLAHIPVEVDYASEFRYRNAPIDEKAILIAVSQSGETADTLAAIREAKRRGLRVLGICNRVGSSVARETDGGVYMHAGPEIGVAATKSFVSQILIFVLLALLLGRLRYLSVGQGRAILEAIERLPDQVDEILQKAGLIQEMAQRYKEVRGFLFLGRQYQLGVALEGALKMKEITYIQAEGHPAAELKHGILALVDENTPTVFLCPRDGVYEKNLSNLQEIKARRGSVIAIATEGDTQIAKLADDVIYVPEAPEFLLPILTVVPLQLLAYYIAVALGRDVDKPRNLAKSVTVE